MAGLTLNVFGHDVSAGRVLRGVGDQADKTAHGIGGSFKKMGAVIAGGFAAAGIGEFLKGSFAEATEAQKVGAQTAAVLKSTGGAAHVTAGQIGDLATAISNKVGIDDEAIQSGENLLLTFTGIRNEVGKGNDIFNQATSVITDMSVALGQDMKSSAIQVGKALNDPIKGVTALQRVGVSFTAKQKDQIKTLVATGHSMDAQKLILRELNKEFGGAAKAQATPAEKAQVAWKNLQEQIGGYLLPVVAKLSTFVTGTLIPAIQSVIRWVDDHREGFQKLGQVLLNIANVIYKQIVKPAIAAIVPVIMSIVHWVETHRVGLERLAKFLGGTLIVAFRTAIVIFKVAIAVIRDIIHIIGTLIDWGRSLVTAIRNAASAVSTAFRAMGDGLKWVWQNVIKPTFETIKGGVRGAKSVIKGLVSGISNVFKGIGAGLQWAYHHVIKPIVDTIMGAITKILDGWDYIKSGGQSQGHLNNGLKQNPDGSYTINAQGKGFSRGGMALVGDQGPEFVNLPRGSKIDSQSVAASKARMTGGAGGDVEIHVHVNGALASTVEIQNAVATGLIEYSRRGGQLPIGRSIR